MYIIAGLGNIGRKYEKTRHNTGFMCIDAFAQKHGIGMQKSMLKGAYGIGCISGEKIVVVKPETYMNLSGECLSAFVNYFKVEPENLIVVYDDVDFPVGSVKIRKSGSAGTHNGMKNIVSLLKTCTFPRIRIGIGDSKDTDMYNYVLSPFTPDENVLIQQAVTTVSAVLEEIILQGVDAAMNRYNSHKKKTAEDDDTNNI